MNAEPSSPCARCEHRLGDHPPDEPCCDKCMGWVPVMGAGGPGEVSVLRNEVAGLKAQLDSLTATSIHTLSEALEELKRAHTQIAKLKAVLRKFGHAENCLANRSASTLVQCNCELAILISAAESN